VSRCFRWVNSCTNVGSMQSMCMCMNTDTLTRRHKHTHTRAHLHLHGLDHRVHLRVCRAGARRKLPRVDRLCAWRVPVGPITDGSKPTACACACAGARPMAVRLCAAWVWLRVCVRPTDGVSMRQTHRFSSSNANGTAS
jgi:hypothetical protein